MWVSTSRFAVQALTRWYESGEDPARRLPQLSTYLGHVYVAGTYWYLSNSPEPLPMRRRSSACWPSRPNDSAVSWCRSSTDLKSMRCLRRPISDLGRGRRDHALILLAVQTGLRLAELTGLRRQDLYLETGRTRVRDAKNGARR